MQPVANDSQTGGLATCNACHLDLFRTENQQIKLSEPKITRFLWHRSDHDLTHTPFVPPGPRVRGVRAKNDFGFESVAPEWSGGRSILISEILR